MYTLEICCGSYQDAKIAEKNGANRIELNSALSLGGLTPTLGSLKLVKQDCKIPVIAMVRPRAGGFCYTREEYETMLLDAKILLEHGADGIAFGFLRSDRTMDEERTKEFAKLVSDFGKESVFHRAFDCLDISQQNKTIEQLIAMGVNRLLTSGGYPCAWDGREQIRELQRLYGSEIQILPASGIRSNNVKELMAYTGVSQVHSSGSGLRQDVTAVGEKVSFAYLDQGRDTCYEAVMAESVKMLRQQDMKRQ